MGAALVVTAVVIVVAVVVAAVVLSRRGDERSSTTGTAGGGRVRRVTLDVLASDAGPAVERIVGTVARGTLDASPEVDEVIVLDRQGTVLGRRAREVRRPLAPPPPDLPPARTHPSAHVPNPVATPPPAPVAIGEAPDVPPRHLTERFDLPAAIREAVSDADDPVELVRAIISSSGRPVSGGDGSLVAGDRFVAVIGSSFERPAIPRVLNDVYLAFLGSGARSGLVVSFDHLDRIEIERRELLAPELRHVGPEAIQQMADAAALGGDPIAFVTGEAYARSAD